MAPDFKHESKEVVQLRAALRGAAERYLSRYASTRAQLKRVLLRRFKGLNCQEGARRALALSLLEEIIETMERIGAVDDQSYAQQRIQVLRRRGDSTRMIRKKLGQKGVAAELIEDCLSAKNSESEEDPELTAAKRLVARRRLGTRPEERKRDLAKLARAGFSYANASRALAGALGEDE